MSPLVLILLSAILVNSAELPSSEPKETAREEKLRSALIDAFQTIKKASAKGGIDDEILNSDLIGSMLSTPETKRTKQSSTENFDVFADEDGLTFAEAFDNIEPEKKVVTTEKSHNVQHIIKTTKTVETTTSRTNKDGILSRLSDSIDSIRSTWNDSGLGQRKEPANVTHLVGIENMLRVFDADILVQQWADIQKQLHGDCKKDMQEYVSGLKERKLWAWKSKYINYLASRVTSR